MAAALKIAAPIGHQSCMAARVVTMSNRSGEWPKRMVEMAEFLCIDSAALLVVLVQCEADRAVSVVMVVA
jgi:hypothetical protein